MDFPNDIDPWPSGVIVDVKIGGRQLDNPNIPEFASVHSYVEFAKRVRHSTRFVWSGEVQSFLDTVIATIQQRAHVLTAGRILFRAQHGVSWQDIYDSNGEQLEFEVLGHSASRMKPLKLRAKEGRANPAGIPVLYLGSTLDTAISEVRPWVGAELSVARCQVLRDLKTLDLSLGHGVSKYDGYSINDNLDDKPLTPAQKKSAVWNDIDNAFSRPVTLSDDAADYVPTQILAELFRDAGYDAILYKSQFGEEKGYNLAVFSPDDVEVVSCAPYSVDAIKVTASQFGNDWYG